MLYSPHGRDLLGLVETEFERAHPEVDVRWLDMSLAFLSALGDFVVSIVLYTYETRPISIEILSELRMQEVGVAAAYGVLLTALSALAFLAWGRGTETTGG